MDDPINESKQMLSSVGWSDENRTLKTQKEWRNEFESKDWIHLCCVTFCRSTGLQRRRRD
ncbi:hypothetical protein A2704_02060 [Candidatus Kaiserbacteria bacterium RIFCSPHIGHO2_01_FULL_54_36b]|uniref:Uncharacterized protein n=1 Tax=Candidatus Kaiserbacteria bacterium RIFCSPHIGHO2_01_FULL_54_36b TaxID=1798483 RepID=A0A1F6CSQ2_9BACT|nr:MAG: hypothetical protein A2704_02060 [Candidatus Kaiserbacteria bacterium RIFCSPHIGHO2_01_FULL_54_36b]